MTKKVSLNPTDAAPEELFELTFEEALTSGRSLSERVPDKEWMETSIRFSVEGLYNWYASYAEQCKDWSVFYLLQTQIGSGFRSAGTIRSSIKPSSHIAHCKSLSLRRRITWTWLIG